MQAQKPTPFILWRIGMNTRYAVEENKTVEIAWAKKRQMQRVVELTYKGRSTTFLYLANIGEVGPQLKDSEGRVLWWREKWSILGFLSRLLFGKMPC